MKKHPSIRVVGLVAVCMMIWFTAGCGNNADRQMLEQQDLGGTYDRAIEGEGWMQHDAQDGGGADGIHDARTRQQSVNNRQNANRANQNQAGATEYEVAEAAADRVAKLDFVRSVYVLKTENNAFVAALLENDGEMSRHMEEQVAQAVRSVDNTVENVYVSTNPSFIDRVDQYIGDVRAGRPVEGFVEEFSEIIDRIFPNAR